MSKIRHMPAAPTRTLVQAGGDVIDRHLHDDHQLIYVSSGVIAISTEHGAWVASNDRALWVPAGTWHEHRFYGNSKFHTIGFPTRSAPLSVEAPIVVAVDSLLRELLIELTKTHLNSGEAIRVRAVVADRLHRAAVAPFSLPIPRDPRLVETCRIVETDLPNPHTLSSLAAQVHASERTLSRLFRTEFGMTYPQWRTRTRLFAAMISLAEGNSVTATAHECGWSTASAFVDTYARNIGATPGTHRAVQHR